jgi:hypothetical protein
MRTIAAIVTSLVLGCGATQAAAGLDPGPDGLGVYFDTEGNLSNVAAPLFTPISMYIVLTRPTFPLLYGWQAAIREADTSTIYVMSTSTPGGGINVGSGMQFSVGYAAPLATQDATVLASVQILVGGWQSICLLLTGIDQPALQDERPLIWIDQDHPTVARVSSRFGNSVSATINENNPIPEAPPSRCSFIVNADMQTWGSLKAHYR